MFLANGRSFYDAWRNACEAPGSPASSCTTSAHMHPQQRARGRARPRGDGAERPQDAPVFDRYDIVSPGDLQAAAATLDRAAKGTISGTGQSFGQVRRFRKNSSNG
jgi:hypothetical protein